MFQALKSIFSSEEPADLKKIKEQGAQLVDVRTQGEFLSGSVKGALNLPLQTLRSELSALDKQKPVIVFCASGARSSSATRLLKSEGFTEVYNGGGWQSLKSTLQ